MQVDTGDSLCLPEETQLTGVNENSGCFEFSHGSYPFFRTHRKATYSQFNRRQIQEGKKTKKQSKFINLVLL